jgi:phage-related tail protein
MIRSDAQGAINVVLESLAGVDKAQQLTVLKKLFGEGISDDIALLVGNLGQYNKALDSVSDKTKYVGSMQKEFDERMKTTGTDIAKMKNAFVELGIRIGEILLPAIKWTVDKITSLTLSVVSFMEKYKTLTSVIVYSITSYIALRTAVLGALLVKNAFRIAALRSANATIFSKIAALGEAGATSVSTAALIKKSIALKIASIKTMLFTNTINFLKGSLILAGGGIKFMFGWVGSIIKAIRSWTVVQGILNVVMSLNPIGLIITGIGLLVAAIVWVANKMGWLGSICSVVWEGIKTAFAWSPFGIIARGIGAAIDWLGEKFEWIGNISKKIGEL